MKHTLYIICALALVACADKQQQAAEGAEPAQYVWEAEAMPSLAVSGEEGLAGAVAGIVNGKLTVWGGANFPDVPAAEGGKKRIWGYEYALADSGWTRNESVDQPIAYAATAAVPTGVVVMGGNDGTGQTDKAWLWLSDGTRTAFAPLPQPTENAAGTYGDGYVYIIGGQTPDGASARAYRIPADGKGEWEELPPLPRAPRVQCSAAWLGGRLYVAGGYDPAEGTVNSTLFSWAPGETSWTFVDSLRKPGEMMTTTLVGGTMLADSAMERLLFIGGVDATIFQDAISRPMRLEAARAEGNTAAVERLETEAKEYMHHEPSWYCFTNAMTSIDLRDGEHRYEVSHNALARAGAAVVQADSVVWVVNGELKPGIRANTVVRLTRRRTR